MPRGLDHIVHAVRDLDAAADFYRRAGFTVGARNRHPWGTHNHVVQFPGFFIEVLTVAEPEKLGDDGLSLHFGAPNREAIARDDGFSMLVLESTDSEADVADFARHGIGASKSLPFSREAKRPDGSSTTVGFSLAFARDALSPHTTFFTCKQHNPAAFWNADYQQHANRASGVLGAVLVADNPTDHHIFLGALTGVRDLHSSSIGVTANTPRGDVEIIEAVSFRDQFGTLPKLDGEGASIKGLRLAVPDIDATERVLKSGGVASHRHIGRLVVPSGAAFGATLIFEAPSKI
ncbi:MULTISPECIES: VOC family protein [unclassified Afipia]|uniref:VOC family protein n=1 Tax=unclassified Afipia TaxID=2642050 RepID=UPI000466D76D|nr:MULTISPECIES: VOC family protein [unclassified Afipia]MAH69973.1 VOC family protein [Afipia sp.]OUX60876.1 MAG: glyoxalase [Afipia sp. TMED4]HAO40743.1 VOC family protein [Afipia sp.]HAP10201.1 VOC family protein [Afipia sp.]HAQ92230.1 VOC family protein [Afipia sp.]